MGHANELERRTARVEEPGRLDRVLALAFADLSRNRLQALIRDGAVALDGVVARETSRRVGAGAEVTVVVPATVAADPEPEDIPLQVVHEDADLIVIDKPAGLVVHPAAGHETGTLVNALIGHCGASLSGINGVRRPGIVHRLDKDTSGLLVVAKTDRAHAALAAQFADHGRTGPLERAYAALVWGVPEPRVDRIEAALARSRRNREKIAVVPEGEGRQAITHYVRDDVLAGGEVSLLTCRLETGRTHQIRVHLADRGHALLGDAVYGGGFLTKASRLGVVARERLAVLRRQALHAAVLGFVHPGSGAFLRFESPLPAELAALLDALRDTPITGAGAPR